MTALVTKSGLFKSILAGEFCDTSRARSSAAPPPTKSATRTEFSRSDYWSITKSVVIL